MSDTKIYTDNGPSDEKYKITDEGHTKFSNFLSRENSRLTLHILTLLRKGGKTSF